MAVPVVMALCHQKILDGSPESSVLNKDDHVGLRVKADGIVGS